MIVTIVDRREMDRLWGTSAFRGVITRELLIDDDCPICGTPRGRPEPKRFHEFGEYYAVSCWVNPCGHLDRYADLIERHNPQAAADKLSAIIGDQAE